MYDIQKVIDEAVKSKNEAEAERHKEFKGWSASQLGSCLSGVYAQRLGIEPEPFDERVLRVFQCGNLFEDFVLDTLDGYDDETKIERPETETVQIAGVDVRVRPDAITTDSKGNQTVLELKSVHSKSFWHMQKEGNPHRHHQIQLWCGLKQTGIQEGKLVYVSKDDLCIAEYPVYLDDVELHSDVTEILTKLDTAWRMQKPPKPAAMDTWQGKYCKYHKDYCVKNYERN